MAEVRVSHFVILVVVLAVIATPILIFMGWLAIPGLDIFGVKTPEINQNVLNKGIDTGLATVSGYTPAKTPTEAMDKFREAIQARKYKFAANYCTKPYADTLTRAHDGAAELGDRIDRIRAFSVNKGLKTDKLTFVLYRLDPFPTNFKLGVTPKQEGDNQAHATFVWDPLDMKNRNPQLLLESDITALDQTMFSNVLDIRMSQPKLGLLSFPVLANPQTSFMKIDLVKDGDDWKLNVPTNKAWQDAVNNFMDKHKTYHTGLSAFIDDMNREQFTNPGDFERGVIDQLRGAKR